MNKISFSWDINKAKSNLIKHKISFEEAKTVFDDDNARLISDPEHSEKNIRIISARKSTKNEEKQYKEYLS
jgi:uncharacterized DUF497 family protein